MFIMRMLQYAVDVGAPRVCANALFFRYYLLISRTVL